MFSFWKKEKQQEIPKEKKNIFEQIDKADLTTRQERYEKGFNASFQVKHPKVSGVGMDSSCASSAFNINTQYGINSYTYEWFASQAFIGFQTMAVIAQNGWIAKMCNLPAKDAIRKGWEVVCNEEKEIDSKVFDEITRLDTHKYNIRNKLVNQSQFTKIYGIRVALFVVESTDPNYYENPFNIDGVKKNSYKGIKQIDPYWCTPDVTTANVIDPANIDFYEPTFWMINGKRYHKSHLVITRGEEVSDLLKPTYQYAGLSLTQKIYDRLYGAERTANEVPMLVQSKRMFVYKMAGVDEKVGNWDAFKNQMSKWMQLVNNYSMRFIGSDDTLEQLDTNLTDLDVNVLTQFQLCCGLANIPSYKLMNSAMKGFSSGETEESSYHEELENIQDYTLKPLLDRHYLLMLKSDIEPKYKTNFNATIKFNELDSITETERATINETKSRTATNYVNAGITSAYDENQRLATDPTSDYIGMEIEEEEEMGEEQENDNRD